MGTVVSRLYKLGKREVQMYNIERRAEKIISKEKPTPAPMYKSTIEELERLKEENVTMDHVLKKNEKLDDYLKKVYVTTPDPIPQTKRIINPERPLPQSRKGDIDLPYGYDESEEVTVPEGYVTLKQALKLVADHREDKEKHSNVAIAAQYKLSLADTNDILEHFQVFSLHVGKKGKEVDPKTLSTAKRIHGKITGLTLWNIQNVIGDLDLQKKKIIGRESTEVKESADKSNEKVNVDKDSSSSKKDRGDNA